jgi:hypothetical protein
LNQITHRRVVDKEGADFYPTPEWATNALCHYVQFSGTIHEPCCGDGAMSKVLEKHGYSVESSDLYDRGYGNVMSVFDLQSCDNFVTNPPFNIAEEVTLHALKISRFKVALLLRTAFMESVDRYHAIFDKTPPTYVYVFTERLTMFPAGSERTTGGTTSYSWFVWDQDQAVLEACRKHVVRPPTTVRWIKPGFNPNGLTAKRAAKTAVLPRPDIS